MNSYITIHNNLFVVRLLFTFKRKNNNKRLREKCLALKDLEKGVSNKDVAAKYGVPKKTSDKNKEKTFRFNRKGKQH